MMKNFFRVVLYIAVLALCGCIVQYHEPTYHVYYHGNGNTEGFAPVDSRVYFSGETATVLAAPADMKKGELRFLGWRWKYSVDSYYQAGDPVSIRDENINFYAIWDGSENPFTYEIDPVTNEVTITKYDGLITDLVNVPQTIEGKPVTRIGYRAFYRQSLKNVSLPEGLKYIDEDAFAGNYLSTVTIPSTVETIGVAAFQNCSLDTLDLSGNVISIGAYAFADNNLYAISIPGVTEVGIGAFRYNKIVTLRIGALVDINSNSTFGTHGDSFITYYNEKGKAAGLYVFGGTNWNGPY
jgi:hypothetical protein